MPSNWSSYVCFSDMSMRSSPALYRCSHRSGRESPPARCEDLPRRRARCLRGRWPALAVAAATPYWLRPEEGGSVMCGRFTLAWDAAGLLRSYVATSDDRAADWEPVYSIAPRTRAPVVREFVDDHGDRHRSLELARWGLRPSWARDKGPRPITARLESVSTNGMFRGSFSSARAVIPMTGYFEWEIGRAHV